MRILYVCNDVAYFNRHRLWLAEAAMRRGATVEIAAGGFETSPRDSSGIHALDIERHRFDIVRDIALMRSIAHLARDLRSEVVHLITIKPVLYGALGLMRVPGVHRIVATFPGLGRVFADGKISRKAVLRRAIVERGLKYGLAPSRVRTVFETEADRDTLIKAGVVSAEHSRHIPGAGVDVRDFNPHPLPDGPLRVFFAGRLLRSKGLHVLLAAARMLRDRGTPVTVTVAGIAEQDHPDTLTPEDIASLKHSPYVDFRGEVAPQGMPALLRECHVLVLPTLYQEGVPRILIEAAATGRPAIVSDIPGCRAIIKHNVNGLVLSAVDPALVANAISRLDENRDVLAALAAASVDGFVAGRFATTHVEAETLELYE